MDSKASVTLEKGMPHSGIAFDSFSGSNKDVAPSILVIEDDVHVSTLVQFIFEREGYRVTVLGDGYAALKYIAEVEIQPGIVLLDVMLPIIDGYEVMRSMKAQPLWREVPIIVLSGRNNETDVMRAFAAGVDDYITKPFQLGELLARVKRFIKEPVH